MYEWTTLTVDVRGRYDAQETHEFLDGYIRDCLNYTPSESYYKNDGRIVIRLNGRNLDLGMGAVDEAQESLGTVFRASVLCANDTGDVVTDLHVYDWLVDEDDWFEPVNEYDTGLYKDDFDATMTDILGWTPETGYWVDDNLREGYSIVQKRLREVLDDRSNLSEETRFILNPDARPEYWENPLSNSTISKADSESGHKNVHSN